jgi:Fur family ferric uptake transcriptional regulator
MADVSHNPSVVSLAATLEGIYRMQPDTQDELAVFRAFIKKKNLRNTTEREVILQAIMASAEHFDADKLYLQLRQKNHKVSKASIYRTIPLLLECELIQQSFYQDGRIVYEHIFGQGHHCHLRCLECGMVVEYSLEDLQRVEQKLSARYGFAVQGHRLEVYGICPQCRAKA